MPAPVATLHVELDGHLSPAETPLVLLPPQLAANWQSKEVVGRNLRTCGKRKERVGSTCRACLGSIQALRKSFGTAQKPSYTLKISILPMHQSPVACWKTLVRAPKRRLAAYPEVMSRDWKTSSKLRSLLGRAEP